MTTKPTSNKAPKIVEKEPSKETPKLDTRPELDDETSLDVIADDLAVDDGDAWPEILELTLGGNLYTYETAAAEDALDYIQISYALDDRSEDRLRTFLSAVLAPGEQELFRADIRAYLVDARKAGKKIEADAFWKQLTENVFERFTVVFSPKEGKPSGGRRRTGRR